MTSPAKRDRVDGREDRAIVFRAGVSTSREHGRSSGGSTDFFPPLTLVTSFRKRGRATRIRSASSRKGVRKGSSEADRRSSIDRRVCNAGDVGDAIPSLSESEQRLGSIPTDLIRVKNHASADADRQVPPCVRPAVCPRLPARLIVPLIRLNCFLARSRENDITRNPTRGYRHVARVLARARDPGLDFVALRIVTQRWRGKSIVDSRRSAQRIASA